MRDKRKSRLLRSCCLGLSAMALGQMTISPALAAEELFHGDHEARTPIKHVIVIIGENRSFDHVFATYVPNRPEEKVFNLLSQGIVKLDSGKNAIPGPNFEKAHQLSAQDTGTTDAFLLSPPKQTFPNDQLPSPLVGGPKVSYIPNKCGSSPITSCEASLVLAQQSENGLDPDYYQFLLSGGTGQTSKTPDERITNVNTRFDIHMARVWAVSADQQQRASLRLLLGKPRAPLLSDVAAAELQPLGCQPRQPVRMRRQSVRLG